MRTPLRSFALLCVACLSRKYLSFTVLLIFKLNYVLVILMGHLAVFKCWAFRWQTAPSLTTNLNILIRRLFHCAASKPLSKFVSQAKKQPPRSNVGNVQDYVLWNPPIES